MPPAQEAPICEAEASELEASGLLTPTFDLRIRCGEHAWVGVIDVARGRDGVFVLADDRLYHLDDRGEVSSLFGWGTPSYWAELDIDEAGAAYLFARNHQHVWRTSLSATEVGEDETVELEELDAGLDRLELHGDRPHLWLGDRHVYENQAGEWIAEPTLVVEGYPHILTSLDGHGDGLGYALEPLGQEPGIAELWAFDGQSTTLVGTSEDANGWLDAVPNAHPLGTAHEHAVFMPNGDGIRLWWPTRPQPNFVDIPISPSYVPPNDELCLTPSGLSAARTSDGRMWLAWVATPWSDACEGEPALEAEAGWLHIVEVDPEISQAREIMRVGIDLGEIETYEGFGWTTYDVPLSLAAYGQELVVSLADGPDDAPLRVLALDAASLPRTSP